MQSKSLTFLKKPVQDVPLILIVDDNEDNILFASGSLQILNLPCIVADSGKKAIEMAINELPDLILLDIVMPDLSGIMVTETLRNNPQTAHIPIIAVTGLTYPIQRQEIMNAGCDDYLPKPYLIEELADKLSCFVNVDADSYYLKSFDRYSS